MPRGKLYARIGAAVGYEYHTAEIKTIEEARRIYALVRSIAHEATA